MSLRGRILALALCISLLFGLVLSGILLATAFGRNLDAELDRGVRSSGMFAASLQASLNAYAGLNDRESTARAVRVTASYMTDAALVAVTGPDGQLIYDNLTMQQTPLLDLAPEGAFSYRVLRFNGTPLQLIRRPVSSDQGTFQLLYGWPLAAVYDGAQAQTRQAVVLLLLLGGLLALALLFSLRAAFGPLRRLEEAAGRIGGGDFAARAPVVHPRDEVGRLATRFNLMAEATQHHVAQLEERDAAQKQFIADMAHELKTPLTSMIGYADLMRRSDLPGDSRHRALDAIVTQGERLERMRDKLLHLARLDGGQQPLFQQVPAADILAQAADSMEEQLRERQVQLLVEADDAHWRCDPDLMIALTQNLLSNACKASAPGQRVWLTAKGPQLSVRDEGEGIPPEHVSRVTEAFYMVDKSRARSRQGAGLGLALALRIAQLHGATLHIASEPQKGTLVTITFTGW